jgi:hypothetical protein
MTLSITITRLSHLISLKAFSSDSACLLVASQLNFLLKGYIEGNRENQRRWATPIRVSGRIIYDPDIPWNGYLA